MRINVMFVALLFGLTLVLVLAAIDQTHALTANAFDQNNQPFQTTFTWVTSNQNAVSVSATGEVRALMSVGSAQITASAGGIKSLPTSVIVAEPAAGAVLVTDAQVQTDPKPLDPEHALELGAQSTLTLTGVSGLAPGTILLASETKPIAGRVVSVTDIGAGKITVILESVALGELLKHYSIEGQYSIQEEFSNAANRARPKLDTPALEGSWGPLKCKLAGSITLGAGAGFTFTLKSEMLLDYRFDESVAMVKLAGPLTGSFKSTLRLAGELGGTASCKLETGRETLPIGGLLAAILALQVPSGVRADLALTVRSPSIELGFEAKATANLTLGFSCNRDTGDCDNLSKADVRSEIKPILNASDSIKSFRIEGNVGIYGYVGLDATSPLGELFANTKPLSLLEAFMGARQEFTFASRGDQANDTTYASKYGLKIYGELGFGSSVKEGLKKLLGETIFLRGALLVIDIPLDQSPNGTNNVDKPKLSIGETTKITISLTPNYLNYIGIGYNVDRILIYRIPPDKHDLEDAPIGTISTGGGQSEFTWTWTPTEADTGTNEFYAFVVTKPTNIPLEVSANSKLTVEVGPGNWSGTFKSGGLDAFGGFLLEGGGTWELDKSASIFPKIEIYTFSGSVTAQMKTVVNCSLTPATQTLGKADGKLTIDSTETPAKFDVQLQKFWNATANCGQGDYSNPITLSIGFQGLVSEDGRTITGNVDLGGGKNITFTFTKR
jgi:Bacterial Ig-like domain (group 2)